MKKEPALRVVPPRRKRKVEIYRFLVVLSEVTPPVWRRIDVPGDSTFWDLHVAIQDAMGWQDYHLHEFRALHLKTGRVRKMGIPDPDFEDLEKVYEGWKVPLDDYFDPALGDALPATYTYDFGDGWSHVVVPEGTDSAEKDGAYPRCVAGARRCPPEDCGGPHGYGEFLAAIADKRHPEHRQMLQWAGGAFDPDDFDPARVRFDDPRARWKKAFGR